MVNMFHCDASVEGGKMEKISVETKDMEQTIENLSTSSKTKPNLVFIGCPHCSLNEIRQIATLIKGKKVYAGKEFWVCTSHYVKERTGDYVKKIEASGGHVLTDMCTIVSWTEMLGIKTIMTNSAKTAYYAPTLNKAETVFAPLKRCLKTVLER